MPQRYHVILLPQAKIDLALIDQYISMNSHAAADAFLAKLQRQAQLLDRFPLRGAKARESRRYGLDIRQIAVSSYRILYVVRGDTVFVLRVGHGARRSLPPQG